MLEETLAKAAKTIANSSYAIALSGAGISVDSGIPDFRSPGGLWERFDPCDFAHIDSFIRNPLRVWEMLFEMRGMAIDAKPNAGHRALAELQDLGRLKGIITQNIDNLHQEAGSSKVVEFHGNTRRLACLECGRKYGADEAPPVSPGKPPRCACGAILKPDVVFFGEAIPADAMHRAISMAERADVMLVVGTSAQVAPANMLPGLTSRNDGTLIEVNLETTYLSRTYKTLHLGGSTTELLPRLVEAVKALM